MLCRYERVHAGEQRKLDTMAKAQARNNAINEGIAMSLREFVHELEHRGGKGRWADKLRQAQQVVATAVSKAAMISRTSYQQIGDALGLDAEMIGSCRKRFEALQNDGEWEQLFDERAAERSDTTPNEWLEFAADYWKVDDLGFVRTSEKMTDEIRDPDDRKAPKQRIVYLESRIEDMYDAMLKAGKTRCVASAAQGVQGACCAGRAPLLPHPHLKAATAIAYHRHPRHRFSDFHLGRTKFRELRPFYVKDATRETCMCIYHLRWAEFSSGLLNYRNQLRKEKVSLCNCNFVGLNEKGLRKQLVCPRAEGASHDCEACVTNNCPDCKGARRLKCGPGSLCADELRDPGGEGRALMVHYEKYQKQTYYTKDGTTKEKKEFSKVLAVCSVQCAVCATFSVQCALCNVQNKQLPSHRTPQASHCRATTHPGERPNFHVCQRTGKVLAQVHCSS